MRTLRLLLTPLVALTLLAGGASLHAQGSLYSQDQINQMVAPIALYPDALMSQVLMAATYPDQVQEADQWVQANPGLTGSALDNALSTATWDPSVIALCKFPTVLDRMAQNIKWTTDLGNAFLSQKADVMGAAQRLRRAAYDSGHLTTTPQQRVEVEDRAIVIQPASPEVIYVPAYEPAVVYGPAWYYPSYYYPSVWAPWPGYSFVNGFAWGIGFAFGNVLFGGCDWYHNDVWVNNSVIYNNNIYHGCSYYQHGDWHGGYGHQPWGHHGGAVDYARGGSGAPYGGMNHGAVRGVERLTSGMRGRGVAQANLRGSGDALRGGGRPAAQGPTNYGERGNGRPSAHGPKGQWAFGGSRPAAHGPTGYGARGNGRMAAEGPTRGFDRSSGRPAARGPEGWSGRTTGRPAAHGPTGYQGRSVTRPEARGPVGYSRPEYTRPAQRAPSAYSRPEYTRPAQRAPSAYSRPGYSRPSARPPQSYGGGGYGRPSGRAPAGVSGGYARGGHAGGARSAPAPRGGQGQHRR